MIALLIEIVGCSIVIGGFWGLIEYKRKQEMKRGSEND